eukprot:2045396-Alexandrium_andersonii.AAC.1
MEEAVVPSRCAGRNVLVPRSESADVGDPFSYSSGRPWRAARKLQGRRPSAGSERGARTCRPAL